MRPIFAIAPLAAVLVLVGPTPHEANVALARMSADIWKRLMPADTGADEHAKEAPLLAANPGLRHAGPAFTSKVQSRHGFDASLQR